jgi:hypothetical protein
MTHMVTELTLSRPNVIMREGSAKVQPAALLVDVVVCGINETDGWIRVKELTRPRQHTRQVEVITMQNRQVGSASKRHSPVPVSH